MKKENKDYETAKHEVSKIRTIIEPNIKFLIQLIEYEKSK